MYKHAPRRESTSILHAHEALPGIIDEKSNLATETAATKAALSHPCQTALYAILSEP
jgi:hypothetical protein